MLQQIGWDGWQEGGKVMKKIMSVLICICLGILVNVNVTEAVTPRVMVSDYSVKEGEVIAGKEFTLTIMLKNTAVRTVKNIKLSISTENGELLPAAGAGTAYVNQIEGDSEEKVVFKMRAANGLEEKAYKLSLKTEYESSGGMEYTVEDAVFIPVSLEQRLSVTDIFMEDEPELGDTVEISAEVNNLGEGTLYNVSASVKGDNLKEQESYVGNIESGKKGTIDFLTKAVGVSQGDKCENQIIVSYEDKAGNVYKKEMDLMVNVLEPVYENLEKVKEKTDHSPMIKRITGILIVIVVILIMVFLYQKRKKRKQQILDEF